MTSAGLRLHARFRVACELLGVLGREQVERIQSISDIYVEGFPFGTTTALLEACARGIPAVVAPVSAPRPMPQTGLRSTE